MARTTLDLDPAVLRDLKRRARVEGKSIGRIASELLAPALAGEAEPRPPAELGWVAQPMGPRVDLDDKDALAALLDDRG